MIHRDNSLKKKWFICFSLWLLLTLIASSGVFAKTAEKPSQQIAGPSSIRIYVGRNKELNYEGFGKRVYKIEDKSVAKIQNNRICGLKEGKTYLYVAYLTSAKYRYTCIKIPVTVSRQKQKITVVKPSGNFSGGMTHSLQAKAHTTCTYHSSNKDVATVNEKGIIKAIRPGKTQITVTAKDTKTFHKATLTFTIGVSHPYKVILYDDYGRQLKSVITQKNFEVPVEKDEPTRTFVGWSTFRTHDIKKVSYYPGDVVVLKSAKTNLYAVYCENSSVTRPNSLPSLSKKYSKLIIVGDSRANRTNLRLQHLDYFKDNSNVEIIGMEGEGLQWFDETGRKLIIQKIRQNQSKKPVAVVMMLGVNHLVKPDDYYTSYTKFVKDTADMNVSLFTATINPYNQIMVEATGGMPRYYKIYQQRNKMLKSVKGMKVIDTCKYLQRTGYVFDQALSDFNNSGIDDGLHYSTNTYLRIFKYVVDSVNNSM